MAGPGGTEVGRARITVLPDTSKFGKALKSYVERIERQLVIQIPTVVDTKGIKEQVERTKRQTERSAPAKLPVQADTDPFVARIRRDVARTAAQIEATIPATVDGEELRRDLAAKVKGISRLLDVEVPLDVENAAAFRAQVLSQVEEVQALARTDPIDVPVEPEPVKGFRARLLAILRIQQTGMPTLKAKVDVDRSNLSALTTVTGQLRTQAAAAGAAIATWGPALLAATAGAVSIAPAVATIAPATIGASLAVGTLAVGLSGLGDAIKDSADPKKFAEAMKGLSKEAQATVKTIVGLKPAFADLRTSVQDALLKGIGPAIQRMAKGLLPVLRTEMTAMATSFNNGAKAFASFTSAGPGLSLIRQNLAVARDALAPLGGAFKPLTVALLQLGIAAGPALKLVNQGITNAARSFAAFIQRTKGTGQLQAAITTAVRGTGKLLAGIGAVLKGLFVGLQAIGPGVIDVLVGAFRGLGVALAALAPIGVFIEQNRQLAAVLGIVAVAALAFVSPITAIVAGILIALNALNTFRGSLSGVGSAFAPITAGLAAFTERVGAQIGPTVAAVTGFIRSLLPSIQAFAQALTAKLGAGLAQIGAVIADDFLPAFQRFLPVIQPVAKFLIETLGNAVVGALGGVISVIKGVLKVLSGLLDFITGVFTGNWTLAWEGIKKIFRGLWDAIIGIVQVAWNSGVVSLLRKGLALIKGIFTGGIALLKGLGTKMLQGLKAGAEAGWKAALAFIKTIPKLIVAVFTAPARLLLTVGRQIIDGLVAGIRGAAGRVTAAARDVVNKIPAEVRKLMDISSPSKVMIEIGRFIGDGLRVGLLGTTDQVSSAAQDFAQKIADAVASLADKRSAIQERITADAAKVKEAQAEYATAVKNAGKTGSDAIKRAGLRLKQAQDKLARDQKAGKGAAVIATDKAAIARAQLAYKQAVAKQGAAAKKAVKTARKKLVDAVAKLNADRGDLRELDASFLGLADGSTQARLQSLIDASNEQLQSLAARRVDVAERLKAAQDQLNEAIKVRDDYAKSLRDAVVAYGDVTKAQANAAGVVSSRTIITSLRKQLAAIVSYRRNIQLLRSGGLSDAALQQILAAGIEGGAATAAGIVKGGAEAITAVNSLTAQIAQEATGLGDEGARWFHQAGVDVAQSLVAGLEAEQNAIEAQSKAVVDGLLTQIKSVLGISVDANGNVQAAVTYQVGQRIGQGLADGMDSSRVLVEQAAARLATAAKTGQPGTVGVIGRGTVGASSVTINVSNPVPETVSTTTTRTLRTLALLGPGR